MQTSTWPTASPSPPPPPATLAANEKLASGPQSSLTELNVWQPQTFTPQMQWGNDYMHARYYSSNLGRFLSVDPVGGKVGSSQSWNRYSYVLNNPMNMTDPTGRVALVDDAAVLGLAVATAAIITWWNSPAIGSPTETNGEVIVSTSKDLASAAGEAIGNVLTAFGGDNTSQPGTTDRDSGSVDGTPGTPADAAGGERAQQLGERASEGTAGEALDQLESIEDRQDRIRKGKADGIIDSTGKSNQRVKTRLDRIKTLEDALEEFD